MRLFARIAVNSIRESRYGGVLLKLFGVIAVLTVAVMAFVAIFGADLPSGVLKEDPDGSGGRYLLCRDPAQLRAMRNVDHDAAMAAIGDAPQHGGVVLQGRRVTDVRFKSDGMVSFQLDIAPGTGGAGWEDGECGDLRPIGIILRN